MKSIRVVLVLMILSSLFMGIKIKDWGFLYGFEFIGFPSEMLSSSTISEIFLWIILIISHGVIFALPFIVKNNNFKKLLIFAPIIYVIAFSLFSIGFLFLLIPFLIFWAVALSLLGDLQKIGLNN